MDLYVVCQAYFIDSEGKRVGHSGARVVGITGGVAQSKTTTGPLTRCICFTYKSKTPAITKAVWLSLFFVFFYGVGTVP